jgi:hypothetical protein
MNWDIILNCKHKVKSCVILQCLYLKYCIRNFAITESHPSVTQYIEAFNELNDNEVNILNSIDSESIYSMLHN